MPTTTPIRTAQHLTLGQLTASGAFAGLPPLSPPYLTRLPSFLASRNRPSPSSSSPSSRPVQRRPLDSADLRARCACLGYGCVGHAEDGRLDGDDDAGVGGRAWRGEKGGGNRSRGRRLRAFYVGGTREVLVGESGAGGGPIWEDGDGCE